MINENYISTFSNMRFDPTNPSPEYICIEDIAHALSMMTRANGHFREFYSVARHSINCQKEAFESGFSKKVQLLCLMHDSAESYIGDMTRPLKKKIPEFSLFEKNLQEIIFKKLVTINVTNEELNFVKNIDDRLLYHEFVAFHGEKLFETPPEIHIDITLGNLDITETKKEFLDIYYNLKNF